MKDHERKEIEANGFIPANIHDSLFRFNVLFILRPGDFFTPIQSFAPQVFRSGTRFRHIDHSITRPWNCGYFSAQDLESRPRIRRRYFHGMIRSNRHSRGHKDRVVSLPSLLRNSRLLSRKYANEEVRYSPGINMNLQLIGSEIPA